MPKAFVLVNTEIGSECDVLRELKTIAGVEEAKLVFGSYDIVLCIECVSMDELKRTIAWQIRKMANITSTQTLILPP
ncbi:MAG: Lrp/AsnC ligand binding domain-containing protein [Candidatus Bathyarchaeia archaeon]|jgi:DNA-binding Lrp family transcriptional regulator